MKLLGTLQPAEGSTKQRKRVGRGNASGNGTTAGRGTKGQNSRSGGGVRPGFEGGQMPLARRLPKFGFFSRKRVVYNEFNVDWLGQFAESTGITTIDIAVLKEHGQIKQEKDGIAILGRGELSAALTIKANHFSKSAREKIEQAGGKIEEV